MKPTDCVCNMAGGFEGSVSSGLFGCQPCADGHYSLGGGTMDKCEPCPMGSYSSQTVGLRDYRQCPSPDSPKLGAWDLQYSCDQPGLSGLVAGAVSCTLCPADRPYTWDVGRTSASDCRKCPKGSFYINGACQACSPECHGPDQYEAVACTEETNRVCLACDYYSCNLVGCCLHVLCL